MTEFEPDPKNCNEIRTELPALLYGELNTAARELLEQHLAACPACRDEYRAQQRSVQLLDTWTEPDPPAISARTAEPPEWAPRRKAHRFVRPALVGAIAAAVVFATLAWLDGKVYVGDGQVVVAFGSNQPISPATDQIDSAKVSTLAQAECDRRFEQYTRVLREELDELVRRQEQALVGLARVVDVQRQEDRQTQRATMEALARGMIEQAARQDLAIRRLQTRVGPDEVRPAAYPLPLREDH